MVMRRLGGRGVFTQDTTPTYDVGARTGTPVGTAVARRAPAAAPQPVASVTPSATSKPAPLAPRASAAPAPAPMPRPAAPAPVSTTPTSGSVPTDYYGLENYFESQGYTGGQAVGMAATQAASGVPASAARYASSPAYKQVAEPQGVAPPPDMSDPYSYFESLIKGVDPSPASLDSLSTQLQKGGIKVLHNAAGIAGKIQLPNGEIVDVGRSFGTNDPNQMAWQWLTGSGGTSSGPSLDDFASLVRSLGLNFGGNPTGAMDTSGGVEEVGQDPFSQAIQGKLSELIANNGNLDDTNGRVEALNLENARQAADRARSAEYSGVLSQLANRGLLPEDVPGGQGGLALDALGRIESNDIAPAFASAVRDYQINDNNNASNRLMGALTAGTQRQDVLSNIALQTLSQNTAFNEFLAQFGLNRDQVLYELASGQNQQLLALIAQYLQAAQTASNGTI